MISAYEIRKYTPEDKELWDTMVENSANGTFLFKRDYMEYHAQRFVDFSLMIYNKGKLVAILPASLHNSEIISHGGLTYGGFVSLASLSSIQLLDIFEATLNYFKRQGLAHWIYKPVPHIYHTYPHDSELYALYRVRAERVACNLSSTIDLATSLPYAELRRRGIKRAKRYGVTILKSNDFAPFWTVLENNLQQRHHVSPVHTLDEINLLHSRFPAHIQLYTAVLDNQVVAGCVVFNTGKVAHAQYISASPEGKKCGALDMLFTHLIEQEYCTCRYFDFGISTEEGGQYLNRGLLSQKEGFGARGTIYETYRITL
ncbi:MAG: GNAT family N-acetyltransferase [Bacteroidaceae bacterium]|nr:GNAT family N-acetyltransferase [Bacteroidaceae bacterium]